MEFTAFTLFYLKIMNQGARIVSDAIIGNDFKVVVVNGKSYIIYPPTIHKIAGAASYLSNVGKIENLEDIYERHFECLTCPFLVYQWE